MEKVSQIVARTTSGASLNSSDYGVGAIDSYPFMDNTQRTMNSTYFISSVLLKSVCQ